MVTQSLFDAVRSQTPYFAYVAGGVIGYTASYLDAIDIHHIDGLTAAEFTFHRLDTGGEQAPVVFR